MEKVYIFGHRNPDTDSVTSAIALEYLKRSLGVYAEARVLGEINDETKYVLNRFNVSVPKYLNDVKLQIKDIIYHKGFFQSENSSIEDVYSFMNNNDITGVPLVDGNGRFKDIITAKMILKEMFKEEHNDVLYTSFDNLLKTLNANEVLRFDYEIKGNITTVSYKSTTFLDSFNFKSDDILIVGDRHSIIEAAVTNGVKLLIITGNGMIKDRHIELAQKNKVNIIRTPLNTFKTVRKIFLSNYAKTIFTKDRPYTVSENDYYDDFAQNARKLGFNNYPVVDKKGICNGLIRVTDINNKNRKKVILVDHNESFQSAVGLDEAEILEVIDHHKIGDISTSAPINFRNMAVGSTNTIIYHLYKENRVEISKEIASIMLAGIMSDTLALTSPTTTQKDREVVEKLEKISGLKYKTFAMDMFNSAANIDNKSNYDILTTDIKAFQSNGKTFRVAQFTSMDTSKILKRKDSLIEEINKYKSDCDCSFVVLLITDILNNGSYLLYDDSMTASNVLERAFGKKVYEGIFLEGIVSRKKQIIPIIMEA